MHAHTHAHTRTHACDAPPITPVALQAVESQCRKLSGAVEQLAQQCGDRQTRITALEAHAAAAWQQAQATDAG